MGKGRHVHTVLLAYSGRAAGGLAAARTNQGTRTHAGEGCAPVCVLAMLAPYSLAAPACALAVPCSLSAPKADRACSPAPCSLAACALAAPAPCSLAAPVADRVCSPAQPSWSSPVLALGWPSVPSCSGSRVPSEEEWGREVRERSSGFFWEKGSNLVFSWWIHMAIDGRDLQNGCKC